MNNVLTSNTLTYAWAAVAVHPGDVGRAGGAGGVRRGGPRRCLRVLLRQIKDAPDGKTEFGRCSHRVHVRNPGLFRAKKAASTQSNASLQAAGPLYALSKHAGGTVRTGLSVYTNSTPVAANTGLLAYKAPSSAEHLKGSSTVAQWR